MTQIKLLKWKADDKRKSWLFLIWTFSFMLCVFAPLEIFFTNRTEFWFSLSQILPIFLIVFGVIGLVFSFGGWYIHDKKAGMYVYGFLLCALLYFYVQGNYVPREYGVLDGADIDWNSYVVYGVISIALILVFLVVWIVICLKIKEKVYLVGRVICVVLGLTQLVTVGTLYIQNNILAGKTSNDIVVTEKDIFNLSEKNNILVFVLDTFDSYIMQDMLEREERESYKELFEDFTYYPDTLGAYPTTKGALPQILTGKWYKNEKPYRDYINEAYNNNEVYAELEKNDYSIGIYTNPVFIGEENTAFINIEKGKYIIKGYGSFMSRMLELVAFNYMPHQLKQFFLIDTSEFEKMRKSPSGYDSYSLDVQHFYGLLKEEGIKVTEENNCFRFYHIEGVHGPYTFDKNLDSIKNKTYEIYDEAKGNFTLLKELFKFLKEREIYDRTTIIIMADHGRIGYNQNPLFMIKNAGYSLKFNVSNQKVTYDCLPEIFSALANGIVVDEKYIEDMGKDRDLRRFISYTWDNSWDKRFMPQMTEYVLDGEAKNFYDMTLTGNVYISEDDKSVYQYTYTPGTKLYFYGKNTAVPFLLYGFSASDEKRTWTDGIKASILFEIEDEYMDLELAMDYSTYMNSQHVIILANGNKIADYQARGEEEKSIIIPREYIEDRKLLLTFEFPDASSPKSAGISDDERDLALGMKTMTLTSNMTERYELDVKLSFMKEDTANNYLLYGFSANEGNYTWTDGSRAAMLLGIDEVDKDLKLVMEYITLGSQRVIIFANGNEIANYQAEGEEEKNIIIPREYVEDGRLLLTFEFPDAVSPKSAGISEDERILALGMKTLTISAAD